MSKDVVYARNTKNRCKNAFVSREVVASNSVSVNRIKSHFIRSLPRPCKMQKVPAKSVRPWQTVYEATVIEYRVIADVVLIEVIK